MAFLDLSPGLELQVFPEPGSIEHAYDTVIASVTDDAIRVTLPRRGDERLSVRPGQRLSAYVAVNGQLHRFSSTVTMTEDFPREALVLTPPDEASNAERREFYRLVTRVTPRYAARIDHHLVELQPLTASVLDLSGGGLQMRTREWVPTGSRIRLVFSLEDDPLEFDLQMAALSVFRPERQQHYRIHCRFVDAPSADVERLVRHVFRQQVAIRRKGAK
jgi:c-di-GMP-binding flagellar brake protein YcgR